MVTVHFFRSVFLAVLGLLMVGGGGRLQAQQPAAPAPVAAVAAAPVPSSYVLAPNDQVLIDVFQEDDLRTRAVISREGTIAMPLVGNIKIGGLTQEQARNRVAELLRQDYLVNPQVSLSVEKFSRKRFTVLGQVQRPGSYDMPDQEGIDLLEAIAMAGGYTRIAQPGSVTIKRRVNGVEQIFKVDAKRMAKDLNSERFAVQQGDTITVAESIF